MGAAAIALSTLFSSLGTAVGGFIGAGGGLTGLLTSNLARLVLGVGLSVLAQKLLAQKPKRSPTEGQQETRQPVPPRSFIYGRIKRAGDLFFEEATSNILFKGIMFSSREIDAMETVYLDDKPVTLDGEFYVQTEPYVDADGYRRVRITQFLGTDNQTVDGQLLAYYPGIWTADHRLRGIAYLVVGFDQPGDPEFFSKVYPGGVPTVQVLIRGCKVYDPRLDSTVLGGSGAHRHADKDTWEWSDNAALCILDWITHFDGYARSIDSIDVATFMTMADLCDEQVDISATGTESRYRVATVVHMTEARKDVLARLLEACDGTLYPTSEGKVAIRGGVWSSLPIMTLDADQNHILAIQLKPLDRLEKYNELKIQFLDPDNKFTENECEPWEDVPTGEEVVSRPYDLTQVPSFSQARRLAKIKMAKDNPQWLVELQTNFYGLNTIGEERVRVVFPELLIDAPFWVDGGPTLTPDFTGVTLRLRSASSAAYDWTLAEEGTGVTVPPDTYIAPTDYLITEAGEFLITETGGNTLMTET